MKNIKVLARSGSEDSSRYIIVDGNIVEVDVVYDDVGLFPRIEPQWELGEVELNHEYESLALGDTVEIIKAQDNPLLSGLELEEGTKLEVVLTVDSF